MGGYNIGYKQGSDGVWHSSVRLRPRRYNRYRRYFLSVATCLSANALSYRLRRVIARSLLYAPVHVQLRSILRQVNRQRKKTGLELLPDNLIPERWNRRKSVRPFVDEEGRGRVVVIDECVGSAEWERVRGQLGSGGLNTVEVVISEEFPGMTDPEIFARLIDEDTTLVTKDAPFHNYVVKMGFESHFLGPDKIISGPIPGIQPKDFRRISRRATGSELPQQSSLRVLLLPRGRKHLKNLRTKRRRIRSHCLGEENICRVTVVLSSREIGSETIIGFIVQVHAHEGVKVLKATEGVIREAHFVLQSDVAGICYAMVNIVRLNLNQKPTAIYCDGLCFDKEFLSEIRVGDHSEPIYRLYERLRRCFGQVTFAFPKKGPYMTSVRKKLESRQAVSGYLLDIIHRVDGADQESESSCAESESADLSSASSCSTVGS